ncbi:MAG: hypothetical protein JNL28_14790 [Planctomycetes bacterium]|nr:hypothetical protein [Planctomycetota bacterium]
MLSGLEFAYPAALALLALPVLVLWFAHRRAARAERDATGTLELWRQSAAEAPRSARRKRLPPAIWWLTAALVAGALASAGPRQRSASDRSLLVVVDRSPSMYLDDRGATRIERALAAARVAVERCDPARVRWIAPPATTDVQHHGARPPDDWLRAPRVPRAAPEFSDYDRAGVLWITDRDLEPRAAGIAASGGVAVPGVIGWSAGRRIEWDGERVVERASDPASTDAAPVLALDARLPERIARVARSWASARGVRVASAASEPANVSALALRVVGEARTSPCELARDGWSARGLCASGLALADVDGPLEPWLGSADGRAVWVAHGLGRVHLALSAIEAPRGDPAAWAVSWATLFDACLAPPPGSASVMERSAAGHPVLVAPDRGSSAGDAGGSAWTALTAATALVLALCALLASGTRAVG